MSLPFRYPQPGEGELLLHRRDLSDLRDILKVRWPVRSSQPLVSALEANRTAIIELVRSSERILESLLTPTDPHSCDRPEDCGHPHCREKIEAWQVEHYAILTRDPADHHPKANPMPDERELARNWEC